MDGWIGREQLTAQQISTLDEIESDLDVLVALHDEAAGGLARWANQFTEQQLIIILHGLNLVEQELRNESARLDLKNTKLALRLAQLDRERRGLK